MKFYRNYDDCDKSNLINATNENVKAGDVVKVFMYGMGSLRVSDGEVTKVTNTTIHVKHESAYPDISTGKWHVYNTTTIFRKHTRFGVSFSDDWNTLYREV